MGGTYNKWTNNIGQNFRWWKHDDLHLANQKVERKVAGSIPKDDEVFWPFFTSKSRDNDAEFHVPTQSWLRPKSLQIVAKFLWFVIICNVADYHLSIVPPSVGSYITKTI